MFKFWCDSSAFTQYCHVSETNFISSGQVELAPAQECLVVNFRVYVLHHHYLTNCQKNAILYLIDQLYPVALCVRNKFPAQVRYWHQSTEQLVVQRTQLKPSDNYYNYYKLIFFQLDLHEYTHAYQPVV